MKGSLHNHMKVGIVHFMAFPETGGGTGPVLETVQRIAEDEFFGAIEVTTIKDDGVRDQVAKLLAATGMIVGFGAQPIELSNKLDINSVDGAKRQASVDFLKGAIDEAYAVGARRFGILSGPDPGDAQRQAAMDGLVDSLDQLCTYAESKGDLAITLEVFDREIDKKSLIGPTATAVELSQMVRAKHPSFGLMVDLSHLPLLFETAQQALSLSKDHLVHAHIGNAVMSDKSHPLYGDLHPRFGHPAGENGVPELVEFLRMLMEIGYIGEGKQNVVAFEVKPYEGDTSATTIANAKRTLMEAWARL